MITDINSEDRLVQATFAKRLQDVLGWESAGDGDTFLCQIRPNPVKVVQKSGGWGTRMERKPLRNRALIFDLRRPNSSALRLHAGMIAP